MLFRKICKVLLYVFMAGLTYISMTDPRGSLLFPIAAVEGVEEMGEETPPPPEQGEGGNQLGEDGTGSEQTLSETPEILPTSPIDNTNSQMLPETEETPSSPAQPPQISSTPPDITSSMPPTGDGEGVGEKSPPSQPQSSSTPPASSAPPPPATSSAAPAVESSSTAPPVASKPPVDEDWNWTQAKVDEIVRIGTEYAISRGWKLSEKITIENGSWGMPTITKYSSYTKAIQDIKDEADITEIELGRAGWFKIITIDCGDYWEIYFVY